MRTFHICLASLVAVIAVIALMVVAMATFAPAMGSAAQLTFFGSLAVTGLVLHYTGWRALQAAPDADIQASSPVFVQSALYALIAASTIAAVVMLTDGHIVGAVTVLAVGVIPWSALTLWFHTQGWMHNSGPDAG